MLGVSWLLLRGGSWKDPLGSQECPLQKPPREEVLGVRVSRTVECIREWFPPPQDRMQPQGAARYLTAYPPGKEVLQTPLKVWVWQEGQSGVPGQTWGVNAITTDWEVGPKASRAGEGAPATWPGWLPLHADHCPSTSEWVRQGPGRVLRDPRQQGAGKAKGCPHSQHHPGGVEG